MTKPLDAIALASASPRRAELLQGLGLRVVVVRGKFEERDAPTNGEPCRELALQNALGKCESAPRDGPPLLIAADTVVELDARALGKPRDTAEAKSMLRLLSNRWHIVHTGFAVLDRAANRRIDGVESTSVRFAELDDDAIDRYVATGDPMDKAGAYGIQGRGALLVERIAGDFYTVMGLPLARVARACRELGYTLR
jgi:septum formation protein